MGQPVVVLGLAHTGTSAIAGALRILGVQFPDVDSGWEMHSENISLVESFNKINSNEGSSEFVNKIWEYDQKFKGHWGFKSPYFAQSFDDIQLLMCAMPENTIYCVTSRDPMAIAERRIRTGIGYSQKTYAETFERKSRTAMKVANQLSDIYRAIKVEQSREGCHRKFMYFPFEKMSAEGGPEKLISNLVSFTGINAPDTMKREAIRYISPKNGYQSPLKFM